MTKREALEAAAKHIDDAVHSLMAVADAGDDLDQIAALAAQIAEHARNVANRS